MSGVLFLLLASGCESDAPPPGPDGSWGIGGEHGEVRFREVSSLVDMAVGPPPYGVLLGTTAWLSGRCVSGSPCARVQDGASLCYTYSWTNASYRDTAATFSAPGPATLNLTPRECGIPATEPQPQPDVVRFDVVAPEDAEGFATTRLETDLAEREIHVDPPGNPVTPPGEPWRVLRGAAIELKTGLRKRGTEARLAHPAGTFELDGAGYVDANPAAPGDLTVRLIGAGPRTLADRTPLGNFTLARLESVDPRALARLEFVTWWTEGLPYAPFLFARVVGRDAEGHGVFGVPGRWSVDRLAFVPVHGASFGAPWDAEEAMLANPCAAPAPGEAEAVATLRVTFGPIEAVKEVRWTASRTILAPDAPVPRCEGGMLVPGSGWTGQSPTGAAAGTVGD